MKRGRLSHAGFFVFRTPLLPVELLKAATQGGTGGSPLDAWATLLDRSSAGTAIALQSSTLWDAVARRRKSSFDLATAPELLPLCRYVSRSTLRCTPRGLFASTGLGTIGKRTVLSTPDLYRTSVVVDLSLNYLAAILQFELDRAGALADASFVVNPTLALFGATVSLRESNGVGSNRTSQQVMLQASELLQELVCSLGAEPITERQVDSLLAAKGVPAGNRSARFRELIAAQILLPNFGVSTTALDPVLHFINQLPTSGALGRVRFMVSEVRAQLKQSAWTPLDFRVSKLHELQAALPPVTGFEQPNQVFQVESFNMAPDLALNEAVINKLAKAVDRLHMLFGDLHVNRMTHMVEAFQERFGEATIPLLRVIDPEHGIGDSLVPGAIASRWAQRSRRASLLRLTHKALGQQLQCIELDQFFWRSISDGELPPLPPGFCAVCSLVAPSEAAIDAGKFEVVLDCVVGTDGTELWARHSRLNGAFLDAVERLDLCVRPTEDDSIVYADVSFAPNVGVDVAWRPGRQRFQIVCTPSPPISGVEQLPLSDLYVRVRNDKIQLLSRRLGRKVVPLIGSAIDPEVARSPLFRFLYSLEKQGYATPLQWDWGELADSPFLPRVLSDGVTLSPARWRIEAADIQCLPRPYDDADVLDRWRDALRLPRLVSIRYGEDRVGCDVTHPVGMDMIRKEVARVGFAILEELRIASEELCVGSEAARFAHELVIPFVHAREMAPAVKGSITRASAWSNKFSRGVMLPGSDWIYAKLYASPRYIQSMLRCEVQSLMSRLQKECGVRDAFFFRYKDTDWHLRLRVHVPLKTKRVRALELINGMAAELQSRETIWRFQYDTYYREVERFGGELACRLVERFFAVESDLVYALLTTWRDDEAYLRQASALAAGWTLWSWACLGLAPDEILDLSRQLGAALRSCARFAGVHNDREGAPQLYAIVDVSSRAGAWWSYARRAAVPLRKIAVLARSGSLDVSLKELAGDLTHLMVNRLFNCAHETRELSVYLMVQRHIYQAGLGESKLKR